MRWEPSSPVSTLRTGPDSVGGIDRAMNDTTPRVELYVRSLAPCGEWTTQEAIVERLLDLERRDRIEAVDLWVWGNAVCLDGSAARIGHGAHVSERIRTFYEWCRDTPASLDPFFTRSAVESSLSAESFDRVVPPHRCLALYAETDLTAVYPCAVGDEAVSLEAGLDALERGRSGLDDVASASEHTG